MEVTSFKLIWLGVEVFCVQFFLETFRSNQIEKQKERFMVVIPPDFEVQKLEMVNVLYSLAEDCRDYPLTMVKIDYPLITVKNIEISKIYQIY